MLHVSLPAPAPDSPCDGEPVPEPVHRFITQPDLLSAIFIYAELDNHSCGQPPPRFSPHGLASPCVTLSLPASTLACFQLLEALYILQPQDICTVLLCTTLLHPTDFIPFNTLLLVKRNVYSSLFLCII